MTLGTTRPDDWDHPVVLPDVSPPERVLVPFDGSHAGERALGWAALVAAGGRAEVVVVVAYDPPITLRGRGALYVEEVKAVLAREADELAGEAVSVLHGRGVRARGVVVRGDVSRGILDAAEDERADVIVMGRRGLTHEAGSVVERFLTILTGGVAEKVTRHADVPVLLVP
jgi:nucleotide-binding universal stress UspA family protein